MTTIPPAALLQCVSEKISTIRRTKHYPDESNYTAIIFWLDYVLASYPDDVQENFWNSIRETLNHEHK